METRIKAIFKGQDGSCGYKNGKEYVLNLTHKRNGKGRIAINRYRVSEMNILDGDCEYDSMTAFLRNWDNIRVNNN
jgi:hypothetical protein